MSVSRLFVALWPPSAAVEALSQAVSPLREALPDVKWQSPSRWHITIAFLGERDEEFELDRFAGIDLVPTEPLVIAGAGRFGPVLYAGIDTGDWIKALAHHTRRACRVRERRRYRPHVTLGRGRTPAAKEQLVRAVAALGDLEGQPWVPGELTLVRSTIGPDPRYEVIARSQLPEGG